jgi:hypothetical protein
LCPNGHIYQVGNTWDLGETLTCKDGKALNLSGVRDNPDFKYKGVNCNSNEKSYMPTYEFGDKAYGFFVGTLTDMNHELGKVFSFRVSGEKSMVEAIVTNQNENFDTIDRSVETDTTADFGIIKIKKDQIISNSPRVG